MELEPSRERDVVTVHARDDLAPCFFPRAFQRGDDPGSFLTNDAHARVVVGLRDRRRPVDRAVVDDDHLEVVEGLRGERRERLRQEGRLVANR